MTDAPQRRSTLRSAPTFIQFPSLDTPNRERWTVSLDSELFTLLDADNRRVLQLHREEAARYMRFAADLLRGMTFSLIVVEGLKRYRFGCTREQAAKLLAWLPHLSQEEVERNVRRSGLVIALLGAFHVLLPAILLWVWGPLLLAAGIFATLRPQPRTYAVNATLLFLVGLWDLLTGSPGDIRPWTATPEHRWLAVMAGSMFLMWAVQQAKMLGANEQLRTARKIRDQRASFLPETSRLVRNIGLACFAAAVPCAAFAAALIATSSARASSAGTAAIPGLPPIFHDPVVFGVAALLGIPAGLLLLLRKAPAYLEAKVAAQAVLALAVFSAWGLVFNGRALIPFSGFPGLFGANLARFTEPWVWVSLVGVVLLFNRWFAKKLDRELEEQRD